MYFVKFFKSYYFELIGSRQSGSLNLALNAKMLDTTLNDQVSSNVKNEIQNIIISSTIVKESFVRKFFIESNFLYHEINKKKYNFLLSQEFGDSKRGD